MRHSQNHPVGAVPGSTPGCHGSTPPPPQLQVTSFPATGTPVVIDSSFCSSPAVGGASASEIRHQEVPGCPFAARNVLANSKLPQGHRPCLDKILAVNPMLSPRLCSGGSRAGWGLRRPKVQALRRPPGKLTGGSQEHLEVPSQRRGLSLLRSSMT